MSIKRMKENVIVETHVNVLNKEGIQSISITIPFLLFILSIFITSILLELKKSTHTWATRPFHVSAFCFIPQGDCPSLKFHFRSNKRVLLLTPVIVVVVVVAAVGAVENDKLVAGGAKAVVVVETRTITARVTSSMRLEMFWIVIIVFFSGRIGRSGMGRGRQWLQ